MRSIVSKTLIIQILSFLFAGVFQILTLKTSVVSADTKISNLYLLSITITGFLTFLDFGLFYSVFIQISKEPLSAKPIAIRAFVVNIRITVAELIILIVVGANLDVPKQILFLILLIIANNFLFLGTVLFRAIYGENWFFILFNLSWPLAFVMTKSFMLLGVKFNSTFAFIPVSCSIFINLVLTFVVSSHFIHTDSLPTTDRDFLKKVPNVYGVMSLLMVFSQILFLSSNYLDRFIMFSRLSDNDYTYYALATQFAVYVQIILLNYSSSLIADTVSQKFSLNRSIVGNFHPLVILGFIGSLAYFLSMPLVLHFFFHMSNIRFVVLGVISFNVFLSTFSIYIAQKFFLSGRLVERIVIQFIGILFYLFLINFVFDSQITLIQAGLALIAFNIGVAWYLILQIKLKYL